MKLRYVFLLFAIIYIVVYIFLLSESNKYKQGYKPMTIQMPLRSWF